MKRMFYLFCGLLMATLVASEGFAQTTGSRLNIAGKSRTAKLEKKTPLSSFSPYKVNNQPLILEKSKALSTYYRTLLFGNNTPEAIPAEDAKEVEVNAPLAKTSDSPGNVNFENINSQENESFYVSDRISVKNLYPSSKQYYNYNFKTEDSTYLRSVTAGPWVDSLLALPVSDSLRTTIITQAKSSAESVASFASSNVTYLKSKVKDGNSYALEKQKKYAAALSCLILVLIGSPLGAIIKKGGFGLPVLISIVFYILMYVLNIQGEKYVKEGQMAVTVGAWLSNVVLLLFGIYFTDRARNDSRLFDKDIYVMLFHRIRQRIASLRGKEMPNILEA